MIKPRASFIYLAGILLAFPSMGFAGSIRCQSIFIEPKGFEPAQRLLFSKQNQVTQNGVSIQIVNMESSALPYKITKKNAGTALDQSRIKDVLFNFSDLQSAQIWVQNLSVSAKLKRIIGDQLAKRFKSQIKNLAENKNLFISVLEFGPQIMSEMTNKMAECDGPNCLNAVKLWHGIERKPKLSDATGLDPHSGSSYERIFSDIEPRFGDVMAIRISRYGSAMVLHAGVFIGVVGDKAIIWHKPSKQKTSPYLFEDFSRIKEVYTTMYDYGLEFEYWRLLNRTN